VAAQMSFLQRFIQPDTIFAEIGPGDCRLTFEMCGKVKKAYAIDVSNEISKQKGHPDNFELIISDGTSIPLPAGTVNVVYSNQLMEHIHPDDVKEQLTNVLNVLEKGGRYVCITPSRINGPHDISRYFDKRASGFHLKEYTFSELKKIFKAAGFSKVHGYIGARGKFIRLPIFLVSLSEKMIGLLPVSARRARIFDPVLNIRVVGTR
jgi:ubiquinone/menaquinone biosynthesis C-methylase UbiE